MTKLTALFLKGLFAILPILATIYLVWWMADAIEGLLGSALKQILPAGSYMPGMGIALGAIIVLAIGILLQAWLFRLFFSWVEKLLEALPMVKSLYGAIKDMLGLFGGGEKPVQQVVMVELGEPRTRLIGFVTRRTFDDLPPGIGETGQVAVYLPMSYQLGGFTVVVPESALTPLEMSMEEALRFAVTAGVTTRT